MATWAQRHRDDLLATGLFVVARALVIGALGVRMDLVFLGFAPHLPDIDLLQRDLPETLLYLHTQPPLYAGFVGLLLGLSPFPDGITFQVAHLAMGLALVLVLRRLFGALGLARATTFIALALVVSNPALIAIEFVASYDQPAILLLALVALATVRYARTGTRRDLGWVAALAMALVLTRTVFHPVWFVAVVAGALVIRKPLDGWRRFAPVVALPALLILALVAKNVVLYGEPGLSTFQGPSLAKIAGSASPPDERQELIAEATVSPLFGRPVFWGWETYADAMPPCVREHPDVDVLAQVTRPNGGYPNMNDECMLAVYRQQGDDARAYLAANPGRFVAAQVGGTQMFFEPSLPIIFTTNDWRLRGLDTAYAWTLFPRVQLQPITRTEFGELRVLSAGGIDLVPTMVVLDLAAIALGIRSFALLARRRRDPEADQNEAPDPKLVAWAAVGLSCLWVTVVGSLLEVNENARYRQLIEPYLLATLAFGGQWLWLRLRPSSPARREPATSQR